MHLKHLAYCNRNQRLLPFSKPFRWVFKRNWPIKKITKVEISFQNFVFCLWVWRHLRIWKHQLIKSGANKTSFKTKTCPLNCELHSISFITAIAASNQVDFDHLVSNRILISQLFWMKFFEWYKKKRFCFLQLSYSRVRISINAGVRHTIVIRVNKILQ